jgi:hypothetical protein
VIGCFAALRLDRRFFAWAIAWALGSLVAFGLVAAIIPNPVFGRQIPPAPFAIAVWLLSAPLMGLLGATYTAGALPAPAAGNAMPLVLSAAGDVGGRQGTTIGTAASLGAFIAIGCPACNKIALVLLGTSGAMTVFAPIQPILGAASIVLLSGTLAWRFRLRARGGACTV